MNQTDLWHDTILDALGSAVQAAGGVKRVAAKLWPTVDSSSAASRLRAALNVEHAQKLDPEEFVAIARLAKEAGDVSVMTFLARELGFEVKALTPEETEEQAIEARRQWHLEELLKLNARKRK